MERGVCSSSPRRRPRAALAGRVAGALADTGLPARDEAVRRAREAAAQAAARAQGDRDRPSDEELGYISTDDSFSKILSDAASGFSERLTEAQKDARDSPVTKRFADLIDELGSKLTGEPPDKR